jgi:hypothetical protein
MITSKIYAPTRTWLLNLNLNRFALRLYQRCFSEAVLFLRKLRARCVSIDLSTPSLQPSPRTRFTHYSNSSRGEGADLSKLKEQLMKLKNKHIYQRSIISQW